MSVGIIEEVSTRAETTLVRAKNSILVPSPRSPCLTLFIVSRRFTFSFLSFSLFFFFLGYNGHAQKSGKRA